MLGDSLAAAHSEDPATRARAVLALRDHVERSWKAVRCAIDALHDPAGEVRLAGAKALRRYEVRGSEHADELLRTLSDPLPSVRCAVLGAIRMRSLNKRMHGQEEFLRLLQSDPDPGVRATAAEILGLYIDRSTPIRLALRGAALEDKGWPRARAAAALDRSPDPEDKALMREALARAIDEAAPCERIQAAKCMLYTHLDLEAREQAYEAAFAACESEPPVGEEAGLPTDVRLLMREVLPPRESARRRQELDAALLKHRAIVAPLLDGDMLCTVLDHEKLRRDPNPDVRAAAWSHLWRYCCEPDVCRARLAEALADTDPRVRRRSLGLLRHGQKDSTLLEEFALPALADADPGVRLSALETLSECHVDAAKAVPAATRLLADADAEVRVKAAEWLVRILQIAEHYKEHIEPVTRTGAVEALRPLLDDTDGRVRGAAVVSLASLLRNSDEALDAAVRAMRDADLDARIGGIGAWNLRGRDALRRLPELLALLDDPDPLVRAEVVFALGRQRDGFEAVLPGLLRALSDRSETVLDRAIGELGWQARGYEEAVQALLRLLEDPRLRIRAHAAIELSIHEHDSPRVRAVLHEAMEAVDPELREKALEAIGRLPDAPLSDLQTLLAAMDDPNEDTRNSASAAIGKLGEAGAVAVPKLVKLLENPRTRHGAAEGLKGLGPRAKDAVPALLRVLSGEAPWGFDYMVGYALAAIGEPARAAVPVLVRAVLDPKGFYGSMAACALRDFGDVAREAIPDLLEAMRSAEPRVRETIAHALEGLPVEDSEFAPRLLELLETKEPQARYTATRILATMPEHSRSGIPGFRKGLEDTAVHTRVMSAYALAQLREADPQAIRVLAEEVQGPAGTWTKYAVDGLTELSALSDEAYDALATWWERNQQDAGLRAAVALVQRTPPPPSAMAAVIRAIDDEEDYERRLAVWALAQMKQPVTEAIPSLERHLAGQDRSLATQAARTLVGWGKLTDTAIAVVIEGLASANEYTRHTALRAVANCEEACRRARDPLTSLLSHADFDTRLWAALCLCQAPPVPDGVFPVAQEALRDECAWTRSMGVMALGVLGAAAGSAVPSLRKLLQDPDEEVRAAVERALRLIETASSPP